MPPENNGPLEFIDADFECAICGSLESPNGELAVFRLNCGHGVDESYPMHPDCLDQVESRQCPVCRQPFSETDEAGLRAAAELKQEIAALQNEKNELEDLNAQLEAMIPEEEAKIEEEKEREMEEHKGGLHRKMKPQ